MTIVETDEYAGLEVRDRINALCKRLLSGNIFFCEKTSDEVCLILKIPRPLGLVDLLTKTSNPTMHQVLDSLPIELRLQYMECYLQEFNRLLPT